MLPKAARGGFDESCLSSEARSAEGEFFRRPRVRGRRRKSGFSRTAGPPVSEALPSTAALYKRSSQGHVVIKGRQNHSCRIRRINPSTTTSSASTVNSPASIICQASSTVTARISSTSPS